MDTDALSGSKSALATRKHATFSDYLALARLDHATKQIFIGPGIALAYLLRGLQTKTLSLDVILGFVAAICIASANYVINEYLDRDYDRHHPTKSQRRAVQCDMSAATVAVEWIAFLAVGLTSALASSVTMFLIACVLSGRKIGRIWTFCRRPLTIHYG
jgi:4-hydroxybenzoate polyprenyltransferase